MDDDDEPEEPDDEADDDEEDVDTTEAAWQHGLVNVVDQHRNHRHRAEPVHVRPVLRRFHGRRGDIRHRFRCCFVG